MYQTNDAVKIHVNELFGKTDETVEEDVQTIRKWLKSQPHLPEIMDEVKIKNMLCFCKFNMEKTKEKIDNYYSVRRRFPTLFENSNPKLPNMRKAMEVTNISNHPDLLDGLYRVTFIRAKAPNTLNSKDVFLLFFAILEIRLQADFAANDVIVVDMCNFTFRDMCSITPALMIKIVRAHQSVYSLRVQSVYFVNCPSYVTMFIKILQFLLPPKIFGRIKVHRDADILKEVFPAEMLPRTYGGDGPSLEELDELMKKQFEKYQERFDLLDTLEVNEGLRPKK